MLVWLVLQVWDRRTLKEEHPVPVGTLAGHLDGITYIDPKVSYLLQLKMIGLCHQCRAMSVCTSLQSLRAYLAQLLEVLIRMLEVLIRITCASLLWVQSPTGTLDSFILGSYLVSLWNISESTQVLVCALNKAWNGTWGLPPPVKLESPHITFTMLVRHKNPNLAIWLDSILLAGQLFLEFSDQIFINW